MKIQYYVFSVPCKLRIMVKFHVTGWVLLKNEVWKWYILIENKLYNIHAQLEIPPKLLCCLTFLCEQKRSNKLLRLQSYNSTGIQNNKEIISIALCICSGFFFTWNVYSRHYWNSVNHHPVYKAKSAVLFCKLKFHYTGKANNGTICDVVLWLMFLMNKIIPPQCCIQWVTVNMLVNL